MLIICINYRFGTPAEVLNDRLDFSSALTTNAKVIGSIDPLYSYVRRITPAFEQLIFLGSQAWTSKIQTLEKSTREDGSIPSAVSFTNSSCTTQSQ
jgi:hypothetical protein